MKMVLFMDGKAGLCILSMKTGLFMDRSIGLMNLSMKMVFLWTELHGFIKKEDDQSVIL